MKWINAADEKPDFYKEVLVYRKDWNDCFVTSWRPGEKRARKIFPDLAQPHWDSYGDQITHWSYIEHPA